jgi:hypothetical protein
LDPILFSDELETTFSDVIQVDRIKSDHDATIAFFPIPYDLQTNYKRDVWLYKHGNYDGLNSEIDQFDWNSHLSSLNDIDEMSSKFSNKYIELAKKYIPVKTVTIRPNDKPWFNSSIRKSMRLRDRLHKQLKRKYSVSLLGKYRAQRNKVNNMVKYAREQFFINVNDMLDNEGKSNP